MCILRTFPKKCVHCEHFFKFVLIQDYFCSHIFCSHIFCSQIVHKFQNCSQFNRIYNVISGFGKEEMAPTYSCLNLRKLSMANNDRFFTEISSSGNSLVIIHIKEKAYIFISTELFLWSAFLLPEVDMKKYLL